MICTLMAEELIICVNFLHVSKNNGDDKHVDFLVIMFLLCILLLIIQGSRWDYVLSIEQLMLPCVLDPATSTQHSNQSKSIKHVFLVPKCTWEENSGTWSEETDVSYLSFLDSTVLSVSITVLIWNKWQAILQCWCYSVKALWIGQPTTDKGNNKNNLLL